MAGCLGNDSDKLRVGWTLPRYVGNAVTRNKLKRQLRVGLEKIVAEKKLKNKGMDVNLIFKKPKSDCDYKQLTQEEVNSALLFFFDNKIFK